MRRLWLALAAFVVFVPSAHAAETKYSIANGCFELQGAAGGPAEARAVTRLEPAAKP